MSVEWLNSANVYHLKRTGSAIRTRNLDVFLVGRRNTLFLVSDAWRESKTAGRWLSRTFPASVSAVWTGHGLRALASIASDLARSAAVTTALGGTTDRSVALAFRTTADANWHATAARAG